MLATETWPRGEQFVCKELLVQQPLWGQSQCEIIDFSHLPTFFGSLLSELNVYTAHVLPLKKQNVLQLRNSRKAISKCWENLDLVRMLQIHKLFSEVVTLKKIYIYFFFFLEQV